MHTHTHAHARTHTLARTHTSTLHFPQDNVFVERSVSRKDYMQQDGEGEGEEKAAADEEETVKFLFIHPNIDVQNLHFG